jgi:hypothetical protein
VDISSSKDLSSKQSNQTKALHWPHIWESISIAFKSSGLLLWFIIFVLALLEIKQYYNIDVIPGYNSSVDDAYGAVKGTISEFFK